MNASRRMHRPGEAGYSLAEMLTVVAIVGILALVTVPAFITFYNSNKVKSSVRNFVTDFRACRELAIKTGRETRISYKTGGAGTRNYNVYQGDVAFGTANTWTAVPNQRGVKYLDDVVYFPTKSATAPQDFTDLDSDGLLDVVFFPDGGVRMPTATATATITIQTDMNVPKKQYQIVISPSGKVVAQ
jgi:prepilin-type N-terminal cleavage/methylation domain-containing protein